MHRPDWFVGKTIASAKMGDHDGYLTLGFEDGTAVTITCMKSRDELDIVVKDDERWLEEHYGKG